MKYKPNYRNIEICIKYLLVKKAKAGKLKKTFLINIFTMYNTCIVLKNYTMRYIVSHSFKKGLIEHCTTSNVSPTFEYFIN